MGGVAAIAVAYVASRRTGADDGGIRSAFPHEFRPGPAGAGLRRWPRPSAAALLFGVLPAWQVTKADAGAGLKEQSRGAIGSFGQMRSGRFLVSLQLALSLPLLVGAGLLARTVYNLQRADLGFPAERLLLVRVDLREAALRAGAPRQPASRAGRTDPADPRRASGEFFATGCVQRRGVLGDDRGGRLRAESRRRPRLGTGCGRSRLLLDVGCPHHAGTRNPGERSWRAPPRSA